VEYDNEEKQRIDNIKRVSWWAEMKAELKKADDFVEIYHVV